MFGAIKAGYKVGQTPRVNKCFFLTLVLDAVHISEE